MEARIYYRYQGAPIDRPGGPWWYGDFETEESARNCISKNRLPFTMFAQAFLLVRPKAQLPMHDPMEIAPPMDAEEINL